jgi:aminoglycoside phosphotransferase (APT) family kinase protein
MGSPAVPPWLTTLRTERARAVPASRWSDLVQRLWPGGALERVEPLVGGLGGLLDRVIAKDPAGRSVSVVVRRFFPEWEEEPEHVSEEVATLAVLEAHGVPAPQSRWSDPAGEVLGRPALAMSDLPGRALARVLEPVGAALAGRLLAALHAIPGEAMHHRRAPGDLAAQVEAALASSRHHDEDFVDRDHLHAVLRRGAQVVIGAPETFLHDDFHPGNVLIDGADAYVIDLTWSTRGDPGRDLGYCRLDLALTAIAGTAEAFLEGYRDAGGAVPEDLWFYDLMAVRRCLPTPAHWLPAFHEQGRTDLTATSVEDRARRFLDDALRRGRNAGVLGTLGVEARPGSNP